MKEQNRPEPKQFSSADFADEAILVTAASEQKQKRKVRLLLILTALCILLGIGFFGLRKLNFYERTLRALNFDYRLREEVSPIELPNPGEKAAAVAGTIGGTVKLSTVEMWFDIKEQLAGSVSAMEYEYSGAGEKLSVKTGVRDGLLTKKQNLRRFGGKTEAETKDDWDAVSDALLPCLYDFCFAAADHGDSYLQCSQSYQSVVGSSTYTCEIWLLQTPTNGMTSYFTLYRYYGKDGRLAAVRVAPGSSDLMAVYEIKDYS